MSFGKKLKQLRFIHQLNQTKMIERLNVSQSVYSRYENDDKSVTENDDFVKRVAGEFDVTCKWLINDDGDKTISENVGNSTAEIKQLESCYSLPKDFMEVYFKQQQQMLEMILNKLGGGK